MRARAILASVLAVALVLSGCARPDRTIAPAGAPQPVESTTAAHAVTAPHASPSRPSLRCGRCRPSSPPAWRRNSGVRPVALTFDDGPSPTWTPKVLDQLRAAKVTATFCVVGREVQRHPELVRRIVREGHQLCNHSWRHDLDLARRPVDEIRGRPGTHEQGHPGSGSRRQGVRSTGSRAAGGRRRCSAVAKDLGMRPLHWSVDPQDWDKPNAATIGKRIHTAARPGAIVLLHDGGGDRAATLAACPHLIADLKKRFGITRLR